LKTNIFKTVKNSLNSLLLFAVESCKVRPKLKTVKISIDCDTGKDLKGANVFAICFDYNGDIMHRMINVDYKNNVSILCEKNTFCMNEDDNSIFINLNNLIVVSKIIIVASIDDIADKSFGTLNATLSVNTNIGDNEFDISESNPDDAHIKAIEIRIDHKDNWKIFELHSGLGRSLKSWISELQKISSRPNEYYN
jgi:hypothetical protein